MPSLTHPLQTSFIGGELSPSLEGRVDIDRYASGLATCENFMVLPQGGVVKRAGFEYIADAKYPDKKCRLIPFLFNDEQAYVLEIGAGYGRVYTQGGLVTINSSGRAGAPPQQTTGAGRPGSGGTNTIPAFKQILQQFMQGASRPAVAGAPDQPETALEGPLPYSEADLPLIRYVQSADIMMLLHPSYQPVLVTRIGPGSFTLGVFTTKDGPYLDQNTDTTITMTPGATTGSTTLTASKPVFFPTHVGAQIRMSGGWAICTAYTSPTVITIAIQSDFSTADATSEWKEGAWSNARGWPRTAAFFEERLMFGGSPARPQTMWGSRSGDFNNFSVSVAPTGDDPDYEEIADYESVKDDDGVVFTIAANKVNIIEWLVSHEVLVIGTFGEEFRMTGGQGLPLTPTNVQVRSGTTFGSGNVAPVRVGNVILFVQRAGRKVREYTYREEVGGWVAPDLSVLADHLTKTDPITEIAYAAEPYPVLWAARRDGTLLACTYDRQADVVAWSRHTFSDGGLVESVCVIPAPDGLGDELWIVVKRGTRRCVERQKMRDHYYEALQVDHGVTYAGPPGKRFFGLLDMAGETVQLIGNGENMGTTTVGVLGDVTFPEYVTTAEVGLPMVATLTTMRVEAPLQGTSQHLKKRWSDLVVRFGRALGGTINGKSLELTGDTAVIQGDKRLSTTGWEREGKVSIISGPLPMEIRALTGVLHVGE